MFQIPTADALVEFIKDFTGSSNDAEIKKCLDMLQHSHAGTGFMHEAFDKDDASKYTRPWFAWANTLFGEFIWKVYREKPHLLS